MVKDGSKDKSLSKDKSKDLMKKQTMENFEEPEEIGQGLYMGGEDEEKPKKGGKEPKAKPVKKPKEPKVPNNSAPVD